MVVQQVDNIWMLRLFLNKNLIRDQFNSQLGRAFGTCGQEGMQVTPQQRANVVNTLRFALDSAGLQSVGIMADESSSTGNFLPEASQWIPQVRKGALASLAFIADQGIDPENYDPEAEKRRKEREEEERRIRRANPVLRDGGAYSIVFRLHQNH